VNDHFCVTKAAPILKIRKQTAHEHARQLEAQGAIKRVIGTYPIAWEKGPFAEAFLAACRGQSGDRVGRSRASAPAIAARFHRDTWSWKIRSGPSQEPPWTEQWQAATVDNFAMRIQLKDGRTYRIWESRGKAHSSLMIQPPDHLEFNRDDLAKAARLREKQTATLARNFAEKYGYRFEGRLEVVQDAEIAFEMPGLKLENTGIPGRTRGWVDHSNGAYRGEVEFKGLTDSEKFAHIPEIVDEFEAKHLNTASVLDGVEAKLRDIEDEQRRLASLVDKEADLIQGHQLITAKEILNRQNGGQHA